MNKEISRIYAAIFLALASEEKNITICDALGDDFTKGVCYRNIGVEIEDMQLSP